MLFEKKKLLLQNALKNACHFKTLPALTMFVSLLCLCFVFMLSEHCDYEKYSLSSFILIRQYCTVYVVTLIHVWLQFSHHLHSFTFRVEV